MVSIFPAAVLMIGFVALFAYRLDDEFMNKIENGLKSRRAEHNL